MEHKPSPIILIVDDEPAILASMRDILQDEGLQVETTSNPGQVLELIGALIPDLVFLDIFIPNSNGLDLLSLIKKEYPAQKVVIISGYANISLAVEALKKGAADFIEKPFTIDDVLSKASIYSGNAEIDPASKDEKIPSAKAFLVGESYLYKELIQYVHRIIPLSTHLIIYGPRGIGKTRLAHYIHTEREASLPCTVIDGILNPHLIIDYTAFTQAGSIIIKHLESLTPTAQQTLLTYMENPSTAARIICLTNKPLYALVSAGLFNEDLFYALSSTPVEIPSLNKRRFDIPLLVNHFLTLINKERNTSFSCSSAATRLLRNHTWNEHCRELYKLLEQVTLSLPLSIGVIEPENLRPFLHETDHGLVEEQRFRSFSSLGEATKNFQRKFLLYQLKKNRYDLEQASNALNMDIAELRNEMARLEILPTYSMMF